ncbi:SET and MYND domain-containing protein 4-like [Anopheles ziemanni]|uniref:SET and MYND domain-containing protein 4-like n=1 Tax=Anopheles coustani TaxID=139045 RepID=UPI0026592B93|nr:SET and MYND domain-containing protein 4-like [Anopheles coustani]XP_058128398.1 SET and MYND domain-containing protein 4-like [Anopheles coustani]XP_058170781.1 SET and MYND domain-containing protein 4-like [Anopheles ziemanni]XP_058170783.1 SET and MYND domain-containing protein 4-like [Anopheles ziemanni]
MEQSANSFYYSDESLVKHVHRFAPHVLDSYGFITPIVNFLFCRLKNNVWAQISYEHMEVENYPYPVPSTTDDPVNLDDRYRLMMRHLERLNQKIAYTEPGTEQLVEAFIERALLSYTFGEDWIAMFNLKLAITIDCIPVTLVDSVKELYLEAYGRAKGMFYPSIGNRINPPLCYSEAYMAENPLSGRHLLARRSLSRGELVTREWPFVRLLTADNLLRCDYCLVYLPFALIPCGGCSQALYCTLTCCMRAFEEYHALECSFIGILRSHYTFLEQLGARLTLRAIRLCNGSMEQLGVLSANRGGYNYNVPLGFNSDPRMAYGMINNLSTNRNRLKARGLFRDGAKAIGLAKLLGPEIERIYQTKNDYTLQMVVAEHLVHHLQIARVNTLYLWRSVEDPEQATNCRTNSKPFAAVLLANGSLFNHSCVPNVHYTLEPSTGAILFAANNDIPRNTMLNINYW